MAGDPSPPPTSPSLLLRLRDPSDQAAWREFVKVYGPFLHRFDKRQGLQEADADDVMQAVMLKVLRQDAGRLEEALQLYEQVLARQTQLLGPDHPHTLKTRNSRATAY